MTRYSTPLFSPQKTSLDISVDPASAIKISDARVGLDIGSTTVKAAVLDASGVPVYRRYARHYSRARTAAAKLLAELGDICENARICLTGSGSLGIAQDLKVDFLQESLACKLAIDLLIPDADAVIELGGEDAKITYLRGGLEQRMNETCAGGTGAFIDQMAAFLGVETDELDRLALKCETFYPIASRCGVFAKSDALPLLNEGCRREDIAGSIMRAVARQTISGLAAGRPLSGKIVVLGGPPRFLASLRAAFQHCLVDAEKIIFPDDGHYYVARGAALRAASLKSIDLNALSRGLMAPTAKTTSQSLPPLFKANEEYENFKNRHALAIVNSAPLEKARGDAWLGVDCGSTTIKAALIDENSRLLFTAYQNHLGEPLNAALAILKNILAEKPAGLTIRGSCGVGYGGAFLKTALRLDIDEVETAAHLRAARHFQPDVSFILDIGGQDIKCVGVRDGAINKISLNEACSSGCGSFVAAAAQSLGLSLPEFARLAALAPRPVDLGARCAVFMNSRIKQAQKDGESVANIAAGLAYSAVRNAIYKTLKLKDPSELGERVVAQGGAFRNDAILRALELELGRPVVRPNIAGLMGAFGAALIAKAKLRESALIGAKEIENFRAESKNFRCGGCENNCPLTKVSFSDDRWHVSGNRCGKPIGLKPSGLPNLYAAKLKTLFERPTLSRERAPRGVIGIPLALNIYEDYPFWHAFFSRLGYALELSGHSTRDERLRAFESAPSQTVCYPAKMAHARVLNLLGKNPDAIFFPCAQREIPEEGRGSLNCPIVAGYPEIVAKNSPNPREIPIIHEFLPLDKEKLPERIAAIPFFAKIPISETREAARSAYAAQQNYKRQIREAGEKTLARLKETGALGVVLIGRPYHLDPDINHGVADLLNSRGLAVLTEDSVAHLARARDLRVVNQWEYHGRLYDAAQFAASQNNLAIIQLVSFGCGLDAITADQIAEIAEPMDAPHAQIKIDEVANLAGADIRARSLLASMDEKGVRKKTAPRKYGFAVDFATRKPKKLLIPQMSPIHFQFAKEIFASENFDAELLPTVDKEALEMGLRHVNNDACYPAILVVGQLLRALKTGAYNPDDVALVMSQTGGACRATNYVALLRKALVDAGLEKVRVANFSTTMHAPGIPLSGKLIHRLIMAGHYGDALARAGNRVRPYEKTRGETEELTRHWSAKAAQNILDGSARKFSRNIAGLVRDFDNLPAYDDERKPRVGLVGEILLKYHPQANNYAAKVIEAEGCEVMASDIMDFISYCFYGHIFNWRKLAGSLKAAAIASAAIHFLDFTRASLRKNFARSSRFSSPAKFRELPPLAQNIVSLGQQAGEGWLLAAEMVKMLREGAVAIICVQPFGCLPNHVVGKGVIREIKKFFPRANITPLDYDPGASETNQINRIKLTLNAASNYNNS